jgi:nitric oxide reductase NorQ protein
LKHEGLQEGSSTRTLISAARLIRAGLPPLLAAEAAIVQPLSDDPVVSANLLEMLRAYLA